MTSPQIITSPSGEELVVLPRAEYDRLRAAAAERDEDAADAAGFAEAMAEYKADLTAGRSSVLPAPVAAMVLKGASRLTAWRKHRGMTQQQLAGQAGISQSYLSELEAGRKAGSSAMFEQLAGILGVEIAQLG